MPELSSQVAVKPEPGLRRVLTLWDLVFYGFGHISRTGAPSHNILLIGSLSFVGAVVLNHIGNAYEHARELLNFGVFLAFMGVNLATFWQFTVVADSKYKRRVLSDTVLPLTGFVFCALIWWNLNSLAKTIGGIWFALGLLYAAVKTRGFRAGPVMIDFTES
jgi:putrescine importer